MSTTAENYGVAKEIYAEVGVDTDEALKLLNVFIAGRLMTSPDLKIQNAVFPEAYRQQEVIRVRPVQEKNL